ncbi:dsRBD fold-containing protein [Streptomyces microflavus]|uniref:dsRBD fold-containing protein n=1 Tax=Streptomyces microflavus TaxID=1919 RepID=UPI00368692BB
MTKKLEAAPSHLGPFWDPAVRANFGQDAHVNIMVDDRTTIAEILVQNEWGVLEPLGRGVARRRKGDRRNSQLGMSLAMARALRHAADRYEDDLKAKGYTL